VETIYRNDENQIALGLNYTLKNKSLHEIEAYDISLLKLLSNGYILEEISREFKIRNNTYVQQHRKAH
jgi:hypothetical protein